jgi:hydroxymethylpyrimidine/phosphomethylpyrimidine kinase
MEIDSLQTGKLAGLALANANNNTVKILIKSIPHRHKQQVDIFYEGNQWHELPVLQVATNNTHGSGDTLSAAIAVHLANGTPLLNAIIQAQQFTQTAIQQAAPMQLGAGHGPLIQFNL